MKAELSCSMQTATCNYSSLPGFNLPVNYLPAATATARGCVETGRSIRVDKGMGSEGKEKEKACACMCDLAEEFHWRDA